MNSNSEYSKDKISVPAVERALDILELLGCSLEPLSLKNISTRLNIPSVSTFRIVKYLCSRSYMKEDPVKSGLYTLGIQLQNITQCYYKKYDLIVNSKMEMINLAEKSCQTVQLGILWDNGVKYIDQMLPTKPVSIIAELHTIFPVNVSASGKILVAYLPENEQKTFLSKVDLPKRTENTITDRNAFLQELSKIKDKGFAIDNEEYARGIGCIAAPIFNHIGKNIAAIGITGHILEYQNEVICDKLSKMVIETAETISNKLGFVDT